MTTHTEHTDRTAHVAEHTAIPFYWADRRGEKKVPGIRIDRSRGWVFIPATELLHLGTFIADYLEENNA